MPPGLTLATVHDTENLTFSADDRAENPHVSARTFRGFRTDNQRIPCGTISKFYSYNDISNDLCGVFLDLLALFRTKFVFWFPPFSNRIRTEDSCPSARKIRARPHGRSASTRAEVPWHPCRKSASFRAEQPRNSSEKVKFSVSCTVVVPADNAKV